jgi:hypothetical protein
MYLSASLTILFSIMTGIFAIFFDASIAHGLFWENDPYWTYWVTKTFLIITVFTIGTAFFGLGIKQGAVITLVHSLILTIYYDWLAPIGLPQEPEWLDFNHLWVTGFPAHYLVIYTGYLAALWMFERNIVVPEKKPKVGDSKVVTIWSLVSALIIIVLDGIITHGLLLRKFPGITYFVQHLLIGFIFLYFWITFIGLERRGWLIGALTLSLIWTTYAMYLGPLGLPNNAPYYLGYDDLWFKAFPGSFVAALIGLWGKRRFCKPNQVVITVFFAALIFATPSFAAEGLKASAATSGKGMFIMGDNPVDMNQSKPLEGSINISVVNHGDRWSHVQNTDEVNVTSEFKSGNDSYRVKISKPMPRHPLGKYTTWSGVVFDHEMHGDTGIGTSRIPKMKPNLGLWGWAEVERNGKVIAKMAPAHVMVMTKPPMKGIMLEIGTEEKDLPGIEQGYITAMWHNIDALNMPYSQQKQREVIGWIVMAALAILFLLASKREQTPAGRNSFKTAAILIVVMLVWGLAGQLKIAKDKKEGTSHIADLSRSQTP